MKKIILLILFILCVLISYSQVPFKSLKAQEIKVDSIVPYTGSAVLLKSLWVNDSIKIGNSGIKLYSGGLNKLYIDNSNTTTPLIYGDFANDRLGVYNTFWTKDTIFMNGTFTSPTDTCSGFINMTDIGNIDLSNSTNPLNTIYCKELSLEEGANAAMGAVVLIEGTLTVNTTKVTANSRIFLTSQDCTNCGWVYISARVAGTSFTITSSNALDTSTIAWMIVESN